MVYVFFLLCEITVKWFWNKSSSLKRSVRREAGSSLKRGRAFDRADINQNKTNLELVSLQGKPKDQGSSLYTFNFCTVPWSKLRQWSSFRNPNQWGGQILVTGKTWALRAIFLKRKYVGREKRSHASGSELAFSRLIREFLNLREPWCSDWTGIFFLKQWPTQVHRSLNLFSFIIIKYL